MFFRLIHVPSSETIALIEMDEELLNPDKGIIDEEKLTVKSVKNGNLFTIIPIEDHKSSVMSRVKESYDAIMEKPGGSISTYFGRYENLLSVVALLFKPVKYYQVRSSECFDKLINGYEDEPEFKEYTV